MKKLSITSATFLILTSASTLALAAPVADTITTFESGTPAVAADVNANFATLKNAININDGEATTHAADAAAHHSKYTDAEATAAATTAAGAAVATHTAVPDAHHAPYTDTNAVGAILAADGPGSGLDADTLDGLDSADLAAAAHTHVGADITDLGACPGDMVAVGSICIDKYEAFVTTDVAGSIAATGGSCNINGTDCSAPGTEIYAQSVAGVTPSSGFTWFQAQQACAMVGKRLPTNAEWQMAAAGTPAPDGTPTACVTDNIGGTGAGLGIQPTGSRAACVSNFGAFDMAGNVLEWVADWMAGNAAQTTGGTPAFGGPSSADKITAQAGSVDGTNWPAGILRGGSQETDTADAGIYFFVSDISPALVDINTGFRCAK